MYLFTFRLLPLACFGQMDSLEYRLRSHIRTSLRTFYILKIVLLPRHPWQHIAYLKLNQPKLKATKFPQKIVCGNAKRDLILLLRVSALRKCDGNLNHQISARFPKYGNALFHPVRAAGLVYVSRSTLSS